MRPEVGKSRGAVLHGRRELPCAVVNAQGKVHLLLLSVRVHGNQGIPSEWNRCDGEPVGTVAYETSGKAHHGAQRMENKR